MLKERLSDLEHARDEGLARADDLRTGWQASLEASLRGIFEHGSEHGLEHGFEHGADSTREEGRP
jgi:hypothetical protein